MACTTWNKAKKYGWTLEDINEWLEGYDLVFDRISHRTRTKVGYTADYLVYRTPEGEESIWMIELLQCPTHKHNTIVIGDANGLGVCFGACDCCYFYEEWLDPR